jgi:hypothetical protein
MATETKIQARYQGTIRDQLRYAPALNRGTPMTLLFSGAALALAILSLPYVYFTVFGLILSALILSGYYVVPIAWWSARRNRWLFEAPVDLTATEAGLEIANAAGLRKIPWEVVTQVREMKQAFVVMLRSGGAYCIPKSALQGDDLSDFRELAAENAPFRGA